MGHTYDIEDPIAHKHIALRRGPIMLAQENRIGYSVDNPISVIGTNSTQAKGFVLSVGANMFKIARPVIVYGTLASVIWVLIYWITTLI